MMAKTSGTIRRELKPSKLRRCHGWDYRRPGSYLITLTLADRTRDWLGGLKLANTGGDSRARGETREHEGARVRGEKLGRRECEGAFVELTPLGEAVARCWREIAEIWPGVEPRELQIMPEHLHGILRVKTPQKHPLGQIIGSFKARSTAAARKLGKTREQAREHGGAIVPASSLGGSLWSPGLHDAILWDVERYRRELAYLLDNPRRLAVKRTHPNLFKALREIVVPLPGAGGALGRFAALGNAFLLDRPLFQVQVSRRDFAYLRKPKTLGAGLEICRDANGEPVVAHASATYESRLEAALQAGEDGQVLLSPCVSDGERQIARAALTAGLPLVVMKNKGFSPLEKPAGRHFEACAAGRLLMLAPVAWPWQTGQKTMTREDATAMNRLCQWLAGETAATINYRGMTPRNVDALAASAVALTAKGEVL